MGHRAAVYTVAVHGRGDKSDVRPFGDIDGRGTYLGDYLDGIFDNSFTAESADAAKTATCTGSNLSSEDLLAMFTHGQKDVAAEITTSAGVSRIHRELDDIEKLRCGVLFGSHVNRTSDLWSFTLITTGVSRAFCRMS